MEGMIPPHSRDLEEVVIGQLMIEPEAYNSVSDIIKRELFYVPDFTIVFDAIKYCNDKGNGVNMLTVVERLRDTKQLEKVGGMKRISEFYLKVSSSMNIEQHIRMLIEKFMRRQLITYSHEIRKYSYDETTDIADLIDITQSNVLNIDKEFSKTKTKHVYQLAKDLERDIDSDENPTHYVPLHIDRLQEITNGFGGGQMILIAARPAMGKTALALYLLYMQAKMGYPGAFYSLEMSERDLIVRLATIVTGISNNKIKSKNLTASEKKELKVFYEEMEDLPLYIEGTTNMKISEFASKARRAVKNDKCRSIYLDYIQLLKGNPRLEANKNDYIGDMSRQVKQTALELNIPIVVLAQLNRDIEKRPLMKQTPVMSDLRDSGALEADADIIMFPTRFDRLGIKQFYKKNVEGLAMIDVQKNRNGDAIPVYCSVSNDVSRWENEKERMSMPEPMPDWDDEPF